MGNRRHCGKLMRYSDPTTKICFLRFKLFLVVVVSYEEVFKIEIVWTTEISHCYYCVRLSAVWSADPLLSWNLFISSWNRIWHSFLNPPCKFDSFVTSFHFIVLILNMFMNSLCKTSSNSFIIHIHIYDSLNNLAWVIS